MPLTANERILRRGRDVRREGHYCDYVEVVLAINRGSHADRGEDKPSIIVFGQEGRREDDKNVSVREDVEQHTRSIRGYELNIRRNKSAA